jgi:hypothetical protein
VPYNKDFLIQKDFFLHSGERSFFKIECDALTEGEIDTFALLISRRYTFGRVIGIPEGGRRIAQALTPYIERYNERVLLVDDVYTTGSSMREARDKVSEPYVAGVVLFARCPIGESWIEPVFQMWSSP